MSQFNNNHNDLLTKFLIKNNIKYIIHTNLQNTLCFNKEIVGQVNQRKAVRNFLINNKSVKYDIYRIIDIKNC